MGSFLKVLFRFSVSFHIHFGFLSSSVFACFILVIWLVSLGLVVMSQVGWLYPFLTHSHLHLSGLSGTVSPFQLVPVLVCRSCFFCFIYLPLFHLPQKIMLWFLHFFVCYGFPLWNLFSWVLGRSSSALCGGSLQFLGVPPGCPYALSSCQDPRGRLRAGC